LEFHADSGTEHAVYFEYETGQMVHRFVVPSLLGQDPRLQTQCRQTTGCESTWLDRFIVSSRVISVDVFKKGLLKRASRKESISLDPMELKRLGELLARTDTDKIADLINLEDIYFERQLREGAQSKQEIYRLWIKFRVSQNAGVRMLSLLVESVVGKGTVADDKKILQKLMQSNAVIGGARIGH
jgi:hypothetical protein